MIPDYTPQVEALRWWRPSLHGDPETYDIMALYSACIPDLPAAAVLVEIGVAHGRSLVWAAAELIRRGKTHARIYGIDPWLGPGDPRSGHSSMAYRDALRCIAEHATVEELQRIHLVRDASPWALRLFPCKSVDLVMIDGCHEYAAVRDDIVAALEVLRPGGMLAGHDHTADFPGVVRAVLEMTSGRAVLRGTVWTMRV
jgi:SAM-dependent methyltransferase